MKSAFALLSVCFMTTAAMAALPDLQTQNPVYGRWTWTFEKNNCTEVYEFRTDNTSVVTSGEEIGESRFTVSDKPGVGGFYQMTDVVTKSNGKVGCDGESGGTPVGDVATVYLLFSPAQDQMVMCYEPSLKSCFGPLKRTSE